MKVFIYFIEAISPSLSFLLVVFVKSDYFRNPRWREIRFREEGLRESLCEDYVNCLNATETTSIDIGSNDFRLRVKH